MKRAPNTYWHNTTFDRMMVVSYRPSKMTFVSEALVRRRSQSLLKNSTLAGAGQISARLQIQRLPIRL